MPGEEKKEVRIMPVLRAYWRATAKYPWVLSALVASIVIAQASSLVAPLYLRNFINTLSAGSVSAVVVSSLFALLIAYAAYNLLNWLSRQVIFWANARLDADAMADLENEAFGYLIGHSYDFFTSNFAGTLTRRVNRYSRSYENVLDSFVYNFLPTFIFALGSIGVLWYRNTWLGLGLLAWVVLFIAVQIVLNKWRHPLRIERVAQDSKMTGALSDAVGNHAAITLFAAETAERASMARIVRAWRKATMRSWNADNIINGVQQLLGIAIEVGLLAVSVFLWQKGLVTVGDFVLIQVYILGLLDQVWGFGNTLRRVYDAFADAYEMVEILETPHQIEDAPGAGALSIARGEIAFEHVGFNFNNGRQVLDDFSLAIKGGEKVALVGPSGAGKSTVTKLLLRLYDPKEGNVAIDGQDISRVTQESLRKAISYVPQESVLFHRSLKDNIAYGKQDATMEEIIEAAKKAHCHEFISQLPQGYETHVGERGVKLSGGERQRVAIARAILKNAPILVLDEATSSLDSESEALIQDALAKLMEGKTVIAIAHRLSTIMKMDRIIVMENGKVVLSGTHAELLAQESNLYKKLWEIQAGGFITADS
ncbi:MAG TPA: ABC transporter ATP-binding protein [Candidatus Paceibacterota bacterium]|nr:ABC transporter ATP-binding protein [Candidatus Paceibacterota bacterium]